MEASKKYKTSDIIKAVLTFLLPIMILFIPTGEVFTPDIKYFMAITLWGILMFVFEQINNMVASILMILAYMVFNVAPMTTVFQPWTADITWMTLSSLFLVAIVLDTRILERIGYVVLSKVGVSYMGVILGVAIMAVVCRLLMGSTAAVSTVALICFALCKACGFGRQRESAGIMLTGVIGYLDSDYFLYSPDFFALLPTNMSTVIPNIVVNYPTMLAHNAVFIVILFVKVLFVGWVCGRKTTAVIKRQAFVDLKNKLPKMDSKEKKILIVLCALIVYLFTQQWHGFSMMYGFILAPMLLCLPGMNVGTKEHLAATNYSFIFFFTGCQAIGQVGAYVGIGDFITATLVPYLTGMSNTVFLIIVWFFAFLLNFLMTPAAEMNAFGGPLAQIAADMNYAVYPTMYTFFNGVSNFVLPYESAWPLFVYSLGLIPMKDFVKVYAGKAVIDFVFLVTVGFLFWRLIGIM